MCLATLALLPGCLSAPPDGTGVDSGPRVDAAVPGDGAPSCSSIVKNDFLDLTKWYSSRSGSAELTLFDDRVEIHIVPESDSGFVEVTSLDARPIEGTRVEAALVVDRSDAGNVSIAFDGTASGGGYYEIAVNFGSLEAVRYDGGTLQVLCGAGCQEYQPDIHRSFRLRARQDRVYYESWNGEVWTQLVPSQPGSTSDFTVSLKSAGDEGEGAIDALLSDFTWQDCLE